MSTSFYALAGTTPNPNDSLLERLTPEGGAVGQVLTKVSSGDFDYNWQSPEVGASLSVLEAGLASKADLSHSHVIADVTGLVASLTAKADVSALSSKADVSALGTKADLSHSHAISDVVDLSTTLSSKADVSHTHAIADVTDLSTSLASKADLSHSHVIADVTDLQTELDSKTTTAQAAVAAPVQSVNGSTGAVVLTLPTSLAAPVITNPTTTAETVVARWAIPANTITAGESFKANVRLHSAGTGTVTWKLHVGSAGTIADTLISTLTTSAAQVANAQGHAEFVVHFPTTTTARGGGYSLMQAVALGVVTGAQTTATIVPTGVVYVSVTATVSLAAANVITAAHGSLSS